MGLSLALASALLAWNAPCPAVRDRHCHGLLPPLSPPPPPARSVSVDALQNWTANDKVLWGLQVSKAAAASNRTGTSGTFTIRSPRNGTLSGVAVNATASASGVCGALDCGGGAAAPATVAVGVPITCTYTCDDDVTAATVGFAVDGYAFSSAATLVTRVDLLGDTACVKLTDPLFSQTEPAWAPRTICQDSAAAAFAAFSFEAAPSAPAARECAAFTDTYTVTDVAFLETVQLSALQASDSAEATVPCPKPTFGDGGSGGARAQATLVMTRNWNWWVAGSSGRRLGGARAATAVRAQLQHQRCSSTAGAAHSHAAPFARPLPPSTRTLAASVVQNQDANGKVWWRNTLAKNEIAGTPAEQVRRPAGSATPTAA
jgi:hypothetical protein